MISEFLFDSVRGFEIKNDSLCVKLLELGASVYSIEYTGRNIALNYDSIAAYMQSGSCIGAIVGRFANRIAGAGFSLAGEYYKLHNNEGENTLHGGADGLPLHKRIWAGRKIDENSVSFELLSPDGDNGFPGNNLITVIYSVEGEKLDISISGKTDKTTAFGPTTHTYFNLDGAKDIRTTKLWINSDAYLECDAALIPSGKLLPTIGKHDFNSLRPITDSFDTCFVLRGEHALVAEAGNIRMTITTDYPGIQLYTGDYLDGGHAPCSGFAAEPEFFPDSPNRPDFPFVFLEPEKEMTKHIHYTFERI